MTNESGIWKKDLVRQIFTVHPDMQKIFGEGREVTKIVAIMSEDFLAYLCQRKAEIYQAATESRYGYTSSLRVNAQIPENSFEFEFDGNSKPKIGSVEVSISFLGDSLIITDQFAEQARWEIDLDFGEDAFTGEPIDYLDGLVHRGMDFPDAAWKTSQKFSVNQTELEQQYAGL